MGARSHGLVQLTADRLHCQSRQSFFETFPCGPALVMLYDVLIPIMMGLCTSLFELLYALSEEVRCGSTRSAPPRYQLSDTWPGTRSGAPNRGNTSREPCNFYWLSVKGRTSQADVSKQIIAPNSDQQDFGSSYNLQLQTYPRRRLF